jgi:hypothetical protein
MICFENISIVDFAYAVWNSNLKCPHIFQFHEQCVNRWLNMSPEKLCPLCRSSSSLPYRVARQLCVGLALALSLLVVFFFPATFWVVIVCMIYVCRQSISVNLWVVSVNCVVHLWQCMSHGIICLAAAALPWGWWSTRSEISPKNINKKDIYNLQLSGLRKLARKHNITNQDLRRLQTKERKLSRRIDYANMLNETL